MQGWNASLTSNVKEWLGIVLDFSGHYASTQSAFFGRTIDADLGLHTFRVGPEFKLRRNRRLQPFGQLLIGGNNTRASDIRIGGARTDESESGTDLAAAVGVGFDLNVSDTISLRLAQGHYSLLRIDQDNRQGVRFSFGIVFKFDYR